jgi:hypothetical protein
MGIFQPLVYRGDPLAVITDGIHIARQQQARVRKLRFGDGRNAWNRWRRAFYGCARQ